MSVSYTHLDVYKRQYQENLGLLRGSEVVPHLADSKGIHLGHPHLTEELENFLAYPDTRYHLWLPPGRRTGSTLFIC